MHGYYNNKEILQQQGIVPLLHYLDDFLFIGPPSSNTCLQHLNTAKQVCHTLGVPLVLEKVEGPATALLFLGILLDIQQTEARLPHEKFMHLKSTIIQWVGRKNAIKREILSLVGQLQHACKVVRYGRTFVARMHSTASEVKELVSIQGLIKPSSQTFAGWIPF